MTSPYLAGVTLAASLALAGCQKPDESFGQKVRAYLLEHPEVIEEAAQALQRKQQLQAASFAKAAIAKNRDKLERDPRDFVANPNGKITVVEFFDYRCGYCKVAAPEILKLIAENPDIRFVFKEFPILSEESLLASQAVLSAPAKPRTLALYRALMTERALDEAAIDRTLLAAGVDPAAAKAAGARPEIRKQISDTHDLAKALGIDGTPTFIVGDRMIPGADLRALQAAIAEARTGKLKTLQSADLS